MESNESKKPRKKKRSGQAPAVSMAVADQPRSSRSGSSAPSVTSGDSTEPA